MPQVPAPKNLLKITALGEQTKTGYVFDKSRWEGEEHYTNAEIVVLFLKGQGLTGGIHEGKDWDWRGGKRADYEFFKVWVKHPKDKDLYSWWTPTKDTWNESFNLDRATWFEFQEAK